MSVEQFENISLVVLITALICFMGFIVFDLAKKSKAGKFGTMVLFGALGMGALGFVIKTVLVEVLNV
ncbi:hypothetical protein BTA51_21510 [Hahella sp. CCB-MM4]|uniref:DUF2788 domain-containing protein n=1 Tax=Hahella sp. (strain CCB-MM4) TaxID=1926491 RepID=UPI000B9AB8C9|nr:DUF2788 domain-containing protein [Hahella sp. CCB-MM4]OZG71229.1 hypothetical protein BTA51_21510 [Hahella sp. CCB-MM4]